MTSLLVAQWLPSFKLLDSSGYGRAGYEGGMPRWSDVSRYSWVSLECYFSEELDIGRRLLFLVKLRRDANIYLNTICRDVRGHVINHSDILFSPT